MRDVLISLKPYYYYLIGEGIKKAEVRKSYPKAEDWSRNSWFYMSRDEKSFAKIPKEFQEKYRKHFGKVGMRFVCDRVIGTCPWRLKGETGFCAKRTEEETKLPDMACLTLEEIEQYAGSRGRGIYGLHITDLVVYDEPRELNEFATVDNEAVQSCNHRVQSYYDGFCNSGYLKCGFYCSVKDDWCDKCKTKPITRPPMSWQFCVATEPRQTAD